MATAWVRCQPGNDHVQNKDIKDNLSVLANVLAATAMMDLA